MKTLKNFENFIKKGIVKKQAPDISRSKFLVNEAINEFNILLEKIEKLSIREDNANDLIKSCYDILLGLTRAIMLLEGYNSIGPGAHEAEVGYLRIIGLSENKIVFVNDLRRFRNGVLYYGKKLDAEYASMVIEKTKQIYGFLLMHCKR